MTKKNVLIVFEGITSLKMETERIMLIFVTVYVY